jgi:hypothetical protein
MRALNGSNVTVRNYDEICFDYWNIRSRRASFEQIVTLEGVHGSRAVKAKK